MTIASFNQQTGANQEAWEAFCDQFLQEIPVEDDDAEAGEECCFEADSEELPDETIG